MNGVVRRHGTGLQALVRPAVTGALIAGALCAGWATATAGLVGLGSAVLAVVLLLAFLLVGQVPLAVAARGQAGPAAMLLVLGYVSRLVIALAAVVAVRSGALDRRSLGVTLIFAGLGWTVGTVWAWRTWQPPVVDVPLPTGPAGPAGPADRSTPGR